MMAALGLRIVALTVGLGLTELTLVPALTAGSATAWLGLLAGLTAIVGGSAGFMVPILAGRTGSNRTLEEITDAR